MTLFSGVGEERGLPTGKDGGFATSCEAESFDASHTRLIAGGVSKKGTSRRGALETMAVQNGFRLSRCSLISSGEGSRRKKKARVIE